MNIVSTLTKYGVIQEMNDWRKHFAAGTKGQPKTSFEILDFVEDLLYEIFPNDESKVNNCKLAPWLVKTVSDIGIDNIQEEDKTKLLTVLNWFKISSSDTPIKNFDLNQAFEYSDKKIKEKEEKNNKSKEEKKPVEDEIYLEDEKKGRIKRVYSVNDGTKRIWVEVIDGSWLTEKGQLNPNYNWGVMCQTGNDFTSSNNQNFQLIGPPKGKTNGPWSTQVGMSGRKTGKTLREIKQEGNQLVGSQSTTAGYSDGDERLVDFLCSNFGKQNILKLTTYSDQIARGRETSGAYQFLTHILENKPDLANKLFDEREDFLELYKDLIIAIKGEEWLLERQIDINTIAETNPEKFLDIFEKLVNRFEKESIEQLQKINIDEIYKKNPSLVLKNISIFIGRIPAEKFLEIFNKIDIQKFASSFSDSYKEVVKFLSNEKSNKIYSEIFNTLLNEYKEFTISIFGTGVNGFKNLISFMETPRLRKHQGAKFEKSNNQYIAEREVVLTDENGQPRIGENGYAIRGKEKFVVPDNLKILDQKERKKFIEQNKEYIKSLVKGSDLEKNISYLRILVPQLSMQEAKSILEKEENGISYKNKILDYYNEKFSSFVDDTIKMRSNKLSKQDYLRKYSTGILDVDQKPVLKKFKPAILEFYNGIKFSNKKDNYIPLAELKKYQNNIILYYYLESNLEDEQERKIESLYKFLDLCKDNKVSDEEIVNILHEVLAKVDVNKQFSFAVKLCNKIFPLINKKLAIKEVKNFLSKYPVNIKNDEFKKLAYQKLVEIASVEKYFVEPGDRVEFKGNDPKLDKLNLITGKKYLVIDTKNLYNNKNLDDSGNVLEIPENIVSLNYYVYVTEEDEIENGGVNIWVPSNRFKIRMEKIMESTVNENMDSFKFHLDKLKNTLNEITDNKNVKYSAIVLDSDSKSKLLQIIEVLKTKNIIGENWTISADHVTINMGKIYDPTLLGKEVVITVKGLGYNEKIAAFKVSTDVDIKYKNKVPHITLAYNKEEGAKPVMSNNLENWYSFKEIKLFGTIEEVV